MFENDIKKITSFPVEISPFGKKICWKELFWGYKHGFLISEQVIGIAVDKMKEGSVDSATVKIASLFDSEYPQVERILLETINDKQCKRNDAEIKDVWLFLSIRWLYNNKNKYSKPFEKLAELYGEFDYPEVMKPFIYYLPPNDRYYSMLRKFKGDWEKTLTYFWEEFVLQKETDLLARNFDVCC